jgi:hypothetical protein
MSFFFVYEIEEEEDGTGLAWRGLLPVESREEVGKGYGGVNIVQIHLYVNEKLIPVETIPGIGGG